MNPTTQKLIKYMQEMPYDKTITVDADFHEALKASRKAEDRYTCISVNPIGLGQVMILKEESGIVKDLITNVVYFALLMAGTVAVGKFFGLEWSFLFFLVFGALGVILDGKRGK